MKTSPLVTLGVVRFWLFVGGAVLAVAIEVRAVVNAVEWCGVLQRPTGLNSFATRPPLSNGLPAVILMVVLFALGAVFIYLAIRARRRRATPN